MKGAWTWASSQIGNDSNTRSNAMNMQAQTPRIIVVDDSEDDFLLIERHIKKTWPNGTIAHARDEASLIENLENIEADLVICDYSMPVLTHDKAIELVEAHRPDTPLILLSGLASDALGIQAMHAGVRDYVEKSKPDRLIPAIRREISTLQLRREKAILEQAHRRAVYFDAVSGFLNREGLVKALSGLMENNAEATDLCVLSINLARSKIRASEVDPRVRRNMFEKIVGRVRDVFPKDMLCRWSDNLLVVVTNGFEWDKQRGLCAERLSNIDAVLNRPFLIENFPVRPNLKLGIAQPRRDGQHAAELVTHAQSVANVLERQDLELLHALDREIHEQAQRRKQIELGLAKGIESGELCLDFQPIEDLNTGVVCGLEALVRWTHPQLGLIMPAEFIDVAEDSGLIEALGQWVIQTAAKSVLALHSQGHLLWCSVNCSPGQLLNPDFGSNACQTIRDLGLDPKWIEFEVTESAAIDDMKRTVETLNHLREQGCKVAMDDFGTGYASLNYLRHLPVDVLKIDKSFVRELQSDVNSQMIVKAVIDLAHALGLVVHAEGIETTEQRTRLLGMGCERLQGYLLSKPLSQPALIHWLNSRNK